MARNAQSWPNANAHLVNIGSTGRKPEKLVSFTTFVRRCKLQPAWNRTWRYPTVNPTPREPRNMTGSTAADAHGAPLQDFRVEVLDLSKAQVLGCIFGGLGLRALGFDLRPVPLVRDPSGLHWLI